MAENDSPAQDPQRPREHLTRWDPNSCIPEWLFIARDAIRHRGCGYGPSLRDRMDRHPAGFDEDEVQSILGDVLTALAAVHREGRAHGNLRAENILMPEDGPGGVRFVDFEPYVLSDEMRESTMTRRMSDPIPPMLERLILSRRLSYMPPGYVSGYEPLAPPADIYTIGGLLRELLTGKKLVSPLDFSCPDCALGHLSGTWRPKKDQNPSVLRPGLERPAFWDSLFYWATRSTSWRYPDADAMLKAVYFGPEPRPVRAGTPWTR